MTNATELLLALDLSRCVLPAALVPWCRGIRGGAFDRLHLVLEVTTLLVSIKPLE
jgi:hypothetical protein